MLYFIKYFAITLCCIYSYRKLLNLSCNKNTYLPSLLFIVCASLAASFSEMVFPHATILILILLSFFFLVQTTHTSPELSFTTIIISYGISYITFAISVVVISIGIISKISINSYNHMICQLFTALIQILITPFLFISKRFKKGMPFLSNKLNRFSVMLTSMLILFSVLLIRSISSEHHAYIFPFLLIFLLAIFIYLSWKNNITKTYLDKLKEKDISELNSSLLEKERRIKELEEENKELAKIIHGDNKLIPAMALAVKSFIQDTSSISPAASQTGFNLLEELNQMSANRKGIIHDQDFRCRTIPPTNVTSIDNLLKYMQQKAHELDIDFNAVVSCDLKPLIQKMSEEEELNTLLADLLENALIATKHNYAHHVLLNIDLIENCYTISIFDSGTPFSKEVLINLGLENCTTHKNDGGSGIGLVSSYELIQKYNASLIIDEYAPKSGLYTKKVSVCFNHMQQYALYTYRDPEETTFLKQRADLLIVQKTMPAAI